MVEKKREHAPEPLADDELENVNGGISVYDKKGRYVGFTGKELFGDVYVCYYPCPKCGRPMHVGKFNFYYCDPCDYWTTSCRTEGFDGTAEEFKRYMKI